MSTDIPLWRQFIYFFRDNYMFNRLERNYSEIYTIMFDDQVYFTFRRIFSGLCHSKKAFLTCLKRNSMGDREVFKAIICSNLFDFSDRNDAIYIKMISSFDNDEDNSGSLIKINDINERIIKIEQHIYNIMDKLTVFAEMIDKLISRGV